MSLIHASKIACEVVQQLVSYFDFDVLSLPYNTSQIFAFSTTLKGVFYVGGMITHI